MFWNQPPNPNYSTGNPLDPLSFGMGSGVNSDPFTGPSSPPDPRPGARPRSLQGDMIGGDCGCHDPKTLMQRKSTWLLGLALVGATAYAWRHR